MSNKNMIFELNNWQHEKGPLFKICLQKPISSRNKLQNLLSFMNAQEWENQIICSLKWTLNCQKAQSIGLIFVLQRVQIDTSHTKAFIFISDHPLS